MGRACYRGDGVNGRRGRLDDLPVHRSAGGFTDIGVVVEDVDRDGILAGNHQIEQLPIARRSLGDVLTFQFL